MADACSHPFSFSIRPSNLFPNRSIKRLVGIRLGKDVLNSLVNTVDSVGLLVGDLNAELLLNSHHNLNSIQGIQTKVVREVGRAVDLAGIGDLVKVLQEVDYPALNLLLVQTGGGRVEADTLVSKARGELSRTSNRRATDLEGSRSPDSTGNGSSQRADDSGTEHGDCVKGGWKGQIA